MTIESAEERRLAAQRKAEELVARIRSQKGTTETVPASTVPSSKSVDVISRRVNTSIGPARSSRSPQNATTTHALNKAEEIIARIRSQKEMVERRSESSDPSAPSLDSRSDINTVSKRVTTSKPITVQTPTPIRPHFSTVMAPSTEREGSNLSHTRTSIGVQIAGTPTNRDRPALTVHTGKNSSVPPLSSASHTYQRTGPPTSRPSPTDLSSNAASAIDVANAAIATVNRSRNNIIGSAVYLPTEALAGADVVPTSPISLPTRPITITGSSGEYSAQASPKEEETGFEKEHLLNQQKLFEEQVKLQKQQIELQKKEIALLRESSNMSTRSARNDSTEPLDMSNNSTTVGTQSVNRVQNLKSELSEAHTMLGSTKTPEGANIWRKHISDLEVRLAAELGVNVEKTVAPVNQQQSQARDVSYEESHIQKKEEISNTSREAVAVSTVPAPVAKATPCEPTINDGLPMVDVIAPANLPAGYAFEAQIGNTRFMATVPSGGVKKGTLFSCPMKTLDTSSVQIQDPADSIPTAHDPAAQSTPCEPPANDALPMVDVIAPANLPAGYAFEAQIGNKRFMAIVPSGGVKKGTRFSCPMKTIDRAQIQAPAGGMCSLLEWYG